jgi:hypothetical protein
MLKAAKKAYSGRSHTKGAVQSKIVYLVKGRANH